MTVVAFAFGAIFFAWVVHVLIWRIRLPRRATRTLLTIFVVGAGVVLAFWVWQGTWTWGGCAYFLVLYGLMALTYLLLYTGIECDSPTLTLSRYLAQSGNSGRTATDISEFVRTRPFVQSRLAELEKGGFVVRQGSSLHLARNSIAVLKANAFYRRLMGRPGLGG